MIHPDTDLAEAHAAIGAAPAILEAFVPFEREISVVAARGRGGITAAYDVCENEHRHHILAETRVPASIAPAAAHTAVEHAAIIAAALDYVGVLAVEMFVVRDHGSERILVNEIAPRVHNSGHWTLDGAQTSQFEQHVRAVAGWPLGAPARLGRIVMGNLIGGEADRWHRLAGESGLHLHLYGKAESRPGRKMGHWTRVLPERA
jgi:5-(carboxyamino)imidazole ribonucleotide synthase